MKQEPAKKSLGQHWLNDHAALAAICRVADVSSGDNVLEVGPGRGSLTRHLLASGANLTAIEYDDQLIKGLEQQFSGVQSGRFRLINADIRKFDFRLMPPGYKIVANIPYYLTANFMRILSETGNKPIKSVLLVQKEVAHRLAANPGQLSLVAVVMQLDYEVSLGRTVEAKLFQPPPKVDSQVVILSKRPPSRLSAEDKKSLIRIIKAGFSNRRKTLENSLSGSLRLPKQRVRKALELSNLDPLARAQTLSLRDWQTLHINLLNNT